MALLFFPVFLFLLLKIRLKSNKGNTLICLSGQLAAYLKISVRLRTPGQDRNNMSLTQLLTFFIERKSHLER